jgi:APA family basic amino acid/polyamine antiporter
VGIVIGAGIYVLLGAAAAEAGAGVWLAFLAAGLLSALTALSYAELASMFPTAGAEYEYTRHVAPLWAAFLVGWLMIVGLVVAAAAVSLGFANYVTYFVNVPERLAALALIVLVTGVALSGIRQSARLTIALTVVQVGGLLAVIIIGLPHVGDHSLTNGMDFPGILSASALVFFAFIGFDEVITLAEETTAPSRTVPRALFLTLGICTALYVMVAVAATSVLGADALAASTQPLADVMATALGDTAGDIVAVVAIIATTNTTLLALTAASRLQYGMAMTNALPSSLAAVNSRRVPRSALLLAAVVAAGFIAIGDLSLVASVTDFAVYVVFIGVNGAVLALRVRQPHRRRPFRVPLSVKNIPLPTIAALATVGIMIPSLDPVALVVGVVVSGAGLAVYVLFLRSRPRRDLVTRSTDMTRKTAITDQDAQAVADQLRIDFRAAEFDLEQFRAGLEVELQHGRVDPDTNVTDDDLFVTGRLVLAHLNEIPDYYSRLKVMRAEAEEYWRNRR